MKVLLFSGTHPRHLYVHRAILGAFEVCGVVCMRREEMLPQPPPGTSAHDAENFQRHFADRLAAEQKYFGEPVAEKIFSQVPVLRCDKQTINTAEVAEFVKKCAPDMAFLFGPALIKEPLMSALPRDRVNLHLGLSPWYRGAATLFWPFYNLEPQFAGSTFHQITPAADAGAIIHQTVPELSAGDGIHDVACKTILASTADLLKLLELRKHGEFKETKQRSSGRLYLSGDFRPEHLRVVYDLFGGKMVDVYLNGEISQHKPELISALKP